MDEINYIHNLDLEWGCITNLMTKISDIEEKMDGGWDELAEMVADCFDEEKEKDPAELFFNLYQFLFRLYYRLKARPEKSEFNRVTKDGDIFDIHNYDYATFKWAKSLGLDTISNSDIRVPASKLTDKQLRHFERKCS